MILYHLAASANNMEQLNFDLKKKKVYKWTVELKCAQAGGTAAIHFLKCIIITQKHPTDTAFHLTNRGIISADKVGRETEDRERKE